MAAHFDRNQSTTSKKYHAILSKPAWLLGYKQMNQNVQYFYKTFMLLYVNSIK